MTLIKRINADKYLTTKCTKYSQRIKEICRFIKNPLNFAFSISADLKEGEKNYILIKYMFQYKKIKNNIVLGFKILL